MSEIIWNDRKRILGIPMTFTKYRMTEDRLFCETGFLNLKEEEILLYRIRDIELKMSLGQRIFGVGTVSIHSSDKTNPIFELRNIKKPRDVKELLSDKVEECKEKRRMKSMEIVDDVCEHELDDEID